MGPKELLLPPVGAPVTEQPDVMPVAPPEGRLRIVTQAPPRNVPAAGPPGGTPVVRLPSTGEPLVSLGWIMGLLCVLALTGGLILSGLILSRKRQPPGYR